MVKAIPVSAAFLTTSETSHGHLAVSLPYRSFTLDLIILGASICLTAVATGNLLSFHIALFEILHLLPVFAQRVLDLILRCRLSTDIHTKINSG